MEKVQEFVYKETLAVLFDGKAGVYLGEIDSRPCILKISRLALPEFELDAKIPITKPLVKAANDIYSWGNATIDEESNVFVECILPATQTHIDKYRQAEPYVVTETPEMYKRVVVPYIQTQVGERIDWVRGILDRGVEAEHVLYRDDKLVLLPNSKWDGTLESLTVLALTIQKDITSIRDLKAEHIPLLKHIKATGLEIIQKKYNLSPSSVKVFFHYHPSFYHLHIHFVHVKLVQADFGKCVFLDNVIQMLEFKPMDQYTLTYIMSSGHQLYGELQKETK